MISVELNGHIFGGNQIDSLNESNQFELRFRMCYYRHTSSGSSCIFIYTLLFTHFIYSK